MDHASSPAPVRPDPAQIARAQRRMVHLAGLSLGLALLRIGIESMSGPLPAGLAGVLMLGQVGAWAGLTWSVWALVSASGHSRGSAWVHAILMLVPLVNLAVLVAADLRAVRVLREMGVKAGLLGVRNEELVRLAAAACPGCGFKCRGIAGDNCPECGKGLNSARRAA